MSAAEDWSPEITARREVAEWAVRLRCAGFSVVPPREDGTKAPIGNWKRYQAEPATDREFARWYGDCQRHGVGVVTGKASGNLEMLDFDHRATWEAYRELAHEMDLGDLLDRVEGGYSENTPKGVHLYWRCGTIGRCGKLAKADKATTLIEIKAEGGYSIAATSHGPINDAGPYTLRGGEPATVATITPDERSALLNLARTFNADSMDRGAERDRQEYTGDNERPGDDYRARGSWAELLQTHGWKRLKTVGGVEHWQRPGKTKGPSATLGYGGSDLLYVFTTSTPFESDRTYNLFSAYAVLEHGGDYSAAARSLREKGYGSKREAPAEVDLSAFTPPEDTSASHRGWPSIAELGADWFNVEPPPREQLLTRSGWDAVSKGMVGLVVAPGGRGKTMAMCQLAISAATGRSWLDTFDVESPGHVALALAEEDLPEIWRRLHRAATAFKLTPEETALAYQHIHPVGMRGQQVGLITESKSGAVETTERHAKLLEVLNEHDYELVILDPLSRFCPDIEASNATATRGVEALEQLTQTRGEPTVLVCHHSNKASQWGGNKANGSTATRGPTALVDGVRWVAQLTGSKEDDLALAITKSNYAMKGGEVRLERGQGGVLLPASGALLARAEAMRSEAEERLNAQREVVLAYVEANPGASKTKAAEQLGGRLQAAIRIVTAMIDDGALVNTGTESRSKLVVAQ